MTAPKRKAKPPPAKAKAGTSRQAAADRRKVFIDSYLANGGNGLQAALVAGFAANSAGVTACKLLKDPRVLAELSQRRDSLAQTLGLSTERTLREVARLAYADPRNFYRADGTIKPIHELDDDTAATIASVEVDELTVDGKVIGITRKIKHWDKNAALEKAMKFHGLYEKDNKQANEKVKVIFMTGGKDPELE
jgi:phage terminase small subunit